MKLFGSTKSNLDSVLFSLIKTLKVKVTEKTIETCLSDHPETPSLLALSDCLTSWNIENQAFRIAREDYDVDDLLFPFIAHLPEKGGRFILIKNINAGVVQFSDEENKRATMPEEEFLKRWDGIALHAELTAESGEKNYSENKFKYFLQSLVLPLGVVLLLSTIGLVFYNSSISWSNALLLLAKLAGLTISVLLLVQSINSNNPFIQNLCSLGGKNNCNAILKSDAAKVTSWLSWSEVGFFYFAGSFLLLLLNPSSIAILAWFNVLALPYTIYSISYQFRSKNWCVLCCAVQALLWIEFLINIVSGHFTFGLDISLFSVGILAICFLLPIVIWAFFKPFFLDAAQLKPIQNQLKTFKYNSDLFKQALTNQPRYAVSDELLPVLMGNADAETVITMVSNPFCGPCSKAHKTIEEWLQTRDDIQLKVIFSTADHDHDSGTKMARHITALSLLKDQSITEKALNAWYDQTNKKYENWAEQFPVSVNDEVASVTEKHRAWCKMAEITFTPTILINGYKLPEPYRLEDIKYLIA
nr:cysteine peptidase family C39 domain-containing protein [Pedobacter sp. ASV2]